MFTRKGQYFLLPVHQIPEFKWKEPGTAIVNVIGLAKGDGIASILPVGNMDDPGASLVFVTRKGQVKRTELKEYSTSRSGAVAACKVAEGDEVLTVALSSGDKEIVLVTREGMSIRFRENEVNPMGRVASGVRGIQLREGDEVVSCFWVNEDEGEILAVTEIGYAKRTLLLDYPAQSRGGKGMPTFEFKEGKRVRPNGSRISGAFYCREPLELVAITREGATQTFSSESAPLGERRSIGKQLVAVEKKDEIVSLFPAIK
ncbi:DNA gyrase subunit A [compost metagenome]